MAKYSDNTGVQRRRRSTPSPLHVGITIPDEPITYSRPARSAGLPLPPSHSSAPTTPTPARSTHRNSSSPSPRRRAHVACQRCRSLKSRCDESWPQCTSCRKARVECVRLLSADDATKNYIEALERRCSGLQKRLDQILDEHSVTSKKHTPGQPSGFPQMYVVIIKRHAYPCADHTVS